MVDLDLFKKKQDLIINVVTMNKLSDEQKTTVKNRISSTLYGVKTCFLTPYSKVSDIVVEARWPIDLVEKKLDQLRRMWGVQKIEPFFLRGKYNSS